MPEIHLNYLVMEKSHSANAIVSNAVVDHTYGSNSHLKPTRFHPLRISVLGREARATSDNRDKLSNPEMPQQFVSISMPHSPTEAHSHKDAKELQAATKAMFYSQPMPKSSALNDGNNSQLVNPRMLDKRFDSFKTSYHGSFKAFSGRRFDKQTPKNRGVIPEGEDQDEETHLPDVNRYFDALEGPELDSLRPSEELLLPNDKKWPFLLRFPISSFGICLGVSSQAIMWKTLSSSPSTLYLHISPDINVFLWLVAVGLISIVSFVYSLKLILYFEAVRREYYHPIRVNFFFAPFIALLFLAMGVPPSFKQTLPESLWYILMAPFLALELKIYGQWMSGGQRRLSKVANPSNHLAVVGNFVGALLGASMGLKEGPIFFFAVGLAHYTVLFVTLYQRLPTNETLPKELHPVFFLFVAAPSVASMAWAKLQGSFDNGSKIFYFIAMFLYFSLVVRLNFFRGFRFSLSWWAYTFPMTGAAIATIKYSNVVTNSVTSSLSVALCAVSTLTVSTLLAATIFHAFVLRDLFPNDIAIAIREKRPKATSKRWYPLKATPVDQYLKYKYSSGKDKEASCDSPPSPNKKYKCESRSDV